MMVQSPNLSIKHSLSQEASNLHGLISIFLNNPQAYEIFIRLIDRLAI